MTNNMREARSATYAFVSSLFLLALVVSVYAKKPSEALCVRQVEATISAMESHANRIGEQARLKDLTVTDIRELQRLHGACDAQAVINQRMMATPQNR